MTKNIVTVVVMIGVCIGSLIVNRPAYGLCEDEKREIQELDKQLLLKQGELAKANQLLKIAQSDIATLKNSIDILSGKSRYSERLLYVVLGGGVFTTVGAFLFGIGLGTKARKDARKHSA